VLSFSRAVVDSISPHMDATRFLY